MRYLRIHGTSANREPPLATYRRGWVGGRGSGSPRIWDRLEEDRRGPSVSPRRDEPLCHGARAECRSPLRAGQEARREDPAAPPPTTCSVNGSTRPRTSGVTCGRFLSPSPMSLQRNGAELSRQRLENPALLPANPFMIEPDCQVFRHRNVRRSPRRASRTFASRSSELFMPIVDLSVQSSSCIASSVTTIRTPPPTGWISTTAATSDGGTPWMKSTSVVYASRLGRVTS